MPLIDIQTNLKSLGFGHDRPDGGSSNQPYIQNPLDINLGIESGTAAANVLGSDFLLRGGVLGAPLASATDVLRIGKFFNPLALGASFNGALFIAKQEVLERQNVDVVDGRSRIYNPLSTLAQVGVNAFGGHLDRTGLNPFKAGYYNQGDTGYYVTTKRNDEANAFEGGTHNRLQLLYQVKRLGNETSDVDVLTRQLKGNGLAIAGTFLASIGLIGTLAVAGGAGGAPRSQLIGTLAIGAAGAALIARSPKTKSEKAKLAADLYGITGTDDEVNLISYGGGPGSILGIGKTDLKIWNPLRFKTPDYSALTSNITKNSDYTNNSLVYLTPNRGSIPNRTARKFGSQTYFPARTRNNTSKILNPNLAVSPDSDTTNVINATGDIIDFGFSLINNNSPGISDTSFSFRAYIEEFSDSFNGEWDTYKYVGRGENFYKYKGFTRDMSISFVIPALSRADMITNYQKINALIWSVMPDYSEKGLMRGQLAKFTMGDYLRDALVVIRTVSLTPIMEMGFDLNMDSTDSIRLTPGDPEYVGQLPKGIKVQCQLTPLTQGITGASPDPQMAGQSVTYYYTPQRGEPFVGNAQHIIFDRDNIAAQYGNVNGLSIEPVNPNDLPLMTIGNSDTDPSSNIASPRMTGTFQEPDINDPLFTK